SSLGKRPSTRAVKGALPASSSPSISVSFAVAAASLATGEGTSLNLNSRVALEFGLWSETNPQITQMTKRKIRRMRSGKQIDGDRFHRAAGPCWESLGGSARRESAAAQDTDPRIAHTRRHLCR